LNSELNAASGVTVATEILQENYLLS
jgi:hypothetical protein